MSQKTHHFVIETMEIENGRRLTSIKPDKDGYYDIVWAVLDGKSRNGVRYDSESFKNCILSPTSRCNILLTEGSLHGEFGHPQTEDLQRVSDIVESQISHHIRKIYAGERLADGTTLVRALIKPFGPYGEYLRESLESPHINTAFSLRSICEQHIDYKTQEIYRKMKLFVTFDYVNGAGFKQSNKRYSLTAGKENIHESFQIHREDFYDMTGTEICYEHIKDKDILDIFGAKDIIIKTESKAIRFEGSPTIITNSGNKESLMHSIISR